MKHGERRVLVAEKASVIQDALSILASSMESEGNPSPEIRVTLASLRKGDYDSLILELRMEEKSADGGSPEIQNIRISHIGSIIVASVEITSPRILRQITELHSLHCSPK